MPYQPIAQTVPQYVDDNGNPYSGAVLKGYMAGPSSTPIPMATDSTGNTLTDDFVLNAAGYPTVSGNIVIPHVDRPYRLALYPNQGAADSDTGAIWFTTDLPIDENLIGAIASYPDITTALQLPKYRAALGKVSANQSNAKVLFIGDSVTFGYASNYSGAGDMRPLSYPDQFKDMLQSSGLRAHTNSWMGDGNSPPNFSSTYDSRVTIGTAWSRSFVYVGGASFTATTGVDALSFNPTEPVDTFVVYYQQVSGGGTLSLDINGGAASTQSTNGANVIQTKVITGSLGDNTLNIKWSAGGAVYVLGVEAYDSTKKWVSCINAGWWGSASSTWNNMLTVSNTTNPISELGADLVIICLGINDWANGTDLTDFENYMQTIITKAKVASDVVLCAPPPSSVSYASAETQQNYVDVLENLALANNIPLVDFHSRLSPQSASFDNGMYYEGIHLNGAGYADMALHMFERIGATGRGIELDSSEDPLFTTLRVGAVSLDASAIAQMDSTSLGFLPPRMTTTQRNAISSPAEGLTVYDTTLDCLCTYDTATSAWRAYYKNITITQTAATVASITQALDFTTNIAYEIYITNLVPVSEPADFIVKLTDDGTNYDTVTTHRGFRADGGSDPEEIGGSVSPGLLADNQDSDANPAAIFFMRISQPLTTGHAFIQYSGAYKNNSGTSMGVEGNMRWTYSAVVTGVQFTYDNAGVVNISTGTFIFKPIPR